MPEKPPAPGSNQVRRALFEDRSPSRILRGWTTADGLTCGIDCQLVGSGWPEATATKLHNILQRHRVTTGINDRALESLAAEARNGNSTGMVVARGTPPEPGRPGALEFIVRPSGQKASFDKRQDSDRVDYHETNVVENVLAGDPVAIELLPRPGIDGLDVFGGTVKASHGRNAEYRLGENVSFDSDSRQILAAIDGRVVWDRNTVSVSRTFHVHGPVDYSVGNIAFVGDVIIDGEVLDGFTVSAGGDITVGGNVGSCKLDAEGSLTISGGVFGKGKAQLRAKGQLRAKFLNDCRAESSGLMIIEREVVGSTVYTNRALLVSGGRLVGGSASALAGIEVDILGSNLGVPTSVSSGTDYNMTRRQGEIEERIAEVDNSVGRISEFLGPLL